MSQVHPDSNSPLFFPFLESCNIYKSPLPPVAMLAMAAESWPPSFLLSLLTREMYVRLTVFQVEMYFSMQVERQLSSLEERESPGVGMQRSKQCSLSFCFGEYEVRKAD